MHPASFRRKDLYKLTQAIFENNKMAQIKYTRHLLGISLSEAHTYYSRDLILDRVLNAYMQKICSVTIDILQKK